MPTNWSDKYTSDTGIVNANHIHANIASQPIAYDVAAVNIDNSLQWNGPALRLESLDLTSYSEAELRGFAGLLEVYLNEKYPPKPPKFNTAEEADAWMEKTYG